MAEHPTIYLTDEEHSHVTDNYESLSGGIRALIQADMAESDDAETAEAGA